MANAEDSGAHRPKPKPEELLLIHQVTYQKQREFGNPDGESPSNPENNKSLGRLVIYVIS